jgi:hypothetical protein
VCAIHTTSPVSRKVRRFGISRDSADHKPQGPGEDVAPLFADMKDVEAALSAGTRHRQCERLTVGSATARSPRRAQRTRRSARSEEGDRAWG